MRSLFSAARLGALLAAILLIPLRAQATELSAPPALKRIEATARQYVIKNSPWAPEDVEVKILPMAALPTGAANFRVVKPSKSITPGPISFLLIADATGRSPERLWVKAEIKLFDEVVVSAVPLARHEAIDPSAVRLMRRDISTLNSRPFKSIDEVIGQQTAHPVEANEILTQKNLDRPDLMRRGSPVTLVYETRALRVESPGYSVEGGKAGDIIQVKNANSGKILRGVVLDERTVRIN